MVTLPASFRAEEIYRRGHGGGNSVNLRRIRSAGCCYARSRGVAAVVCYMFLLICVHWDSHLTAAYVFDIGALARSIRYGTHAASICRIMV